MTAEKDEAQLIQVEVVAENIQAENNEEQEDKQEENKISNQQQEEDLESTLKQQTEVKVDVEEVQPDEVFIPKNSVETE